MDIIRIMGLVIFGIGIIIEIANTKWQWPFWKYTLESRNKKLAILSNVLIILGFLLVIFRVYMNRRNGT